MIIKEGVVLVGLVAEMQLANVIASKVWALGHQTLVVTSGLDGTHMAGSKHYSGNACDYRTRYFKDAEETAWIAGVLQRALGDDYDVVIEPSHIHCEYDPK